MEDRRIYEEVRALVEANGGTMEFMKEGYQWGAWILKLDGATKVFQSNGSGYPDLDQLYEPKSDAVNLNDWRNYTTTLKPNAREKFLQLFAEK